MDFIETDTLILGASFYGCGLARALHGATVVEEGVAPGGDEVFGFSPGTGWTTEPGHPEALELRRELLRRQALTPEGRLLTGALAPVLADWCLRRGVVPRLGLSEVEISGDLAIFTDYCGFRKAYRARRIIDARDQRSGPKLLTASICSPTPLDEGETGNFQITFSGVDGLYYAALRFDEAAGWPEARKRFIDLWNDRPSALAHAELQLIAARFTRRRFANAVAALDAGLSGQFVAAGLNAVSAPAPVSDACDVAVVGFGTAGCTAAVAAARRGARVLVIERNTYPGGTWTGGFVPRCYIQAPTGIASDFYEAAVKMSGFRGITEPLKFVQERAALDSGVNIGYAATLLDVTMDRNRASGIVWRDSLGVVHTTSAAVVIDATAEATVCRLAGCELSRGRSSDGEFNRYTNSMGVCRPSDFGVANFDAGRVAQYDTDNFSLGYLTGFLRHLADDFRAGLVCIQPSDLPGLREGDRIIPERTYTLEEFFNTRGDDSEPLFYVVSNLDTHANDIALERELFQDWIIAASLWEVRLVIPVPFRVLFPRRFSGLIAAGRHLGVDHELGYAIRMIPAMAAVGEAAGVIAAKSVAAGISPDALPYAEFSGELRRQLEHSTAVNRAWYAMSVTEIRDQLAGCSPGLAMWNAWRQGRHDLLMQWFNQARTGSNLRRHAALALAFFNEPAAIPELLDMAGRRDAELINPGMARTHSHGCAAVYLLGRLRASAAVPMLKKLLENEDQDEYIAHIVIALIKIGDADIETRVAVAVSLRRIAEDKRWKFLDQLNGGGGKYRTDGLFRLHIARALDRWQIKHHIAEIVAELHLNSHEKWLWKQYMPLNVKLVEKGASL